MALNALIDGETPSGGDNPPEETPTTTSPKFMVIYTKDPSTTPPPAQPAALGLEEGKQEDGNPIPTERDTLGDLNGKANDPNVPVPGGADPAQSDPVGIQTDTLTFGSATQAAPGPVGTGLEIDDSNLEAANPPGLPPPILPTPTPTPTLDTSPSSSPTSDQSNASENSQDDSKTPIGAIAGGIIGGAIGLTLLTLLILFLIRRRNKAKGGKKGASEAENGQAQRRSTNSDAASNAPSVEKIVPIVATPSSPGSSPQSTAAPPKIPATGAGASALATIPEGSQPKNNQASAKGPPAVGFATSGNGEEGQNGEWTAGNQARLSIPATETIEVSSTGSESPTMSNTRTLSVASSTWRGDAISEPFGPMPSLKPFLDQGSGSAGVPALGTTSANTTSQTPPPVHLTRKDNVEPLTVKAEEPRPSSDKTTKALNFDSAWAQRP